MSWEIWVNKFVYYLIFKCLLNFLNTMLVIFMDTDLSDLPQYA